MWETRWPEWGPRRRQTWEAELVAHQEWGRWRCRLQATQGLHASLLSALCSLHEALCMEGGVRDGEQSGGGVQGGTSAWGPSWGEQQSGVESGEGQQPLPVLSLTRAPELGGLRCVRLLSLTGLPSSQTCFRPSAPQRKVQRLADDIRVHH